MCDHHIPKNKRFGSALEHGKAHIKDHFQWSRRTFLKTLGVAGTMSMAMGNMRVTASMASPLMYALNGAETDRVLVMIRLKGGNDGLNTIVPLYDHDYYSLLRPTVAIPENEVLKLSDDVGVPNSMSDVMPLWNDGQMKVVHSVGYPDQNLSHFRSSDIWASATDADEFENSGWLGRFLTNEFPDYLTNPPTIPPAIQIGGFGNLIFQNSDAISMAMAVSDPDQLYQIAQTGSLHDVINLPDCFYGDQLGFVRTVANSTFTYAESIKDAFDASTTDADYGGTNLGEQLSLVARLIKGNLGTKFYMVSIGGFDTHALQQDLHPILLNSIAMEVNNFLADLKVGDKSQDVLCMTFSEFGRRIEQNGSDGTDHGSSAPVMMFGEGLNGNGFVGTVPNLQDPDIFGNLKYDIDFRQIYASVLENWLCIDGAVVDDILLGAHFDRLDGLGLECSTTSIENPYITLITEHHARYADDGRIAIHYKLPEAMHVRVGIFNMLGQPVKELFNGTQLGGEHKVTFYDENARLASAIYIYKIEAGGKVYSSPIRVMAMR